MIRLIPAVLAAVATPVIAQGVYQPVPRSNDPFVFCTEGAYRLPSEAIRHCWQPVDPATGTWVYSCWSYCNASAARRSTRSRWASTRCCAPQARTRQRMGREVPANMTPFWH